MCSFDKVSTSVTIMQPPAKKQKADGRRKEKKVAHFRALICDKVSNDFHYGIYSRVEEDTLVPRATARYWCVNQSFMNDFTQL